MERQSRTASRILTRLAILAVISAASVLLTIWLFHLDNAPSSIKAEFLKDKVKADNGDTEAQFSVAVRFSDGIGTAKDQDQALSYFFQAAAKHHPGALQEIGLRYAYGRDGLQQDRRKALPFLTEAVSRNEQDPHSLIALAEIMKIQGGPDNLAKSAKYFKLAGELGYCDGQCGYAEACRDGIAIPKDYVEAYAWYNLAVGSLRDDDARKERDSLENKMTKEQIAEAQKRTKKYQDAIKKRRNAPRQ